VEAERVDSGSAECLEQSASDLPGPDDQDPLGHLFFRSRRFLLLLFRERPVEQILLRPDSRDELER
jgi:hypothetical protein